MEKNNTVIDHRSDCAISLALDAIGDKWSLIILRDIMFHDKRSYTELQSSEEHIATNILASRLSKMEEHGILLKETDPANRRRFIYYLTEKGIELFPVLLELTFWMKRHEHDAQASGEIMNHSQCKEHREAYIKSEMEKLRKLHVERA